MKLSTKLKAGVAALALAGVVASSATALTSTFNVTATFVDPFSIAQTTQATFGELVAEVNTTYSLAADSTLTPGPGGSQAGAVVAAAGAYNVIDAAAGGAVDITVDNQQAGANGFITINAFNCDWNAGAAATTGATCAFNAQANPTAAGDTLLVGFDITVANTPADAATDTAAFDITVAYD